MKQLVIPLAVAVLVIAACHDQGPIIPADAKHSSIIETSPVQQVVGGGTFVREDLQGAPRGTYAFHAQLDAAGNASGDAEVHFATIDVQVHIEVQCVAVQRNEAWLSGPVTRSNDPSMPVGRVLLWQVQDNGDGGTVLADRISSFAYSGTSNYAPDVCRWMYPMTTRPWENGNVRILTPSSLGLSDIVGTWDVTKYICVNLANPADTQSLAGSGLRMRETIAPDGHYTMVWWIDGPPARIYENTRGSIDVVDGVVQVTGDETQPIIVSTVYRSGNIWRIEFDGNVCHWDDDGEEDPSHVVAELHLKRTGILVTDLAGVWDAAVFRFTSIADPSVSVDLVNAGVAVTLTLGLDSHYTSQFGAGPGGDDAGEMIFEGNQMLVRSESPEGSWQESHVLTFELRGTMWSFAGAAEWDFDGDPATPREPAMLKAVLVRR